MSPISPVVHTRYIFLFLFSFYFDWLNFDPFLLTEFHEIRNNLIAFSWFSLVITTTERALKAINRAPPLNSTMHNTTKLSLFPLSFSTAITTQREELCSSLKLKTSLHLVGNYSSSEQETEAHAQARAGTFQGLLPLVDVIALMPKRYSCSLSFRVVTSTTTPFTRRLLSSCFFISSYWFYYNVIISCCCIFKL